MSLRRYMTTTLLAATIAPWVMLPVVLGAEPVVAGSTGTAFPSSVIPVSGAFASDAVAEQPSKSTLPLVANAPRTTIRFFVTLTWEGRDLREHNLAALRAFREAFPAIQLVHFVSPAYFTHHGADVAAVKSAIRSVLRPNDKLGVAVGGWKSVVDQAGVIFRNGPTFWGHALRAIDCRDDLDCGLDVPLNVYPQQEVAQITRASLDVLQAQGFGRAAAALATGWVASPQVLEAFAQSGIRYDFSAVAPELVSRRLSGFPLYQWVRGIWSNVTPHTQPYVLPSVSTSLTEIPQSIAAIDYLQESDVVAIFKEYAERLRREPNRDLTFQLAIYQETARQTLPTLTKSLQSILDYASAQKISLQPFDVSGLDIPADPTSSATPAVAH